mmetsp:Transcript_5301/g.12146  ORF Transcript_5301/g.12146 Transcript_5301/m.12146 type:complete len:213 (-) Transcript_5301:720-1358(-)
MKASPMVLIFSTWCREQSWSSCEKMPCRTMTTCSAETFEDSSVNPTMSQNITETRSSLSAMCCSELCISRSPIDAGKMFNRSSSVNNFSVSKSRINSCNLEFSFWSLQVSVESLRVPMMMLCPSPSFTSATETSESSFEPSPHRTSLRTLSPILTSSFRSIGSTNKLLTLVPSTRALLRPSKCSTAVFQARISPSGCAVNIASRAESNTAVR